MSGGESVPSSDSIVIELIQLVGDVVMFADHRSKPDVAFSMPRKGWDDLGNPTVITVTARPGGNFTPKPDPIVERPTTPAGAKALADMVASLDRPGAYL